MLIYRVESKNDRTGPFLNKFSTSRLITRIYNTKSHPSPLLDGLRNCMSDGYNLGTTSMKSLKNWFVDSIDMYNARMSSFGPHDIIWPTEMERDRMIAQNNEDIRSKLTELNYHVVVLEAEDYDVYHSHSGRQVAFVRDNADLDESFPIDVLYS